MKNEGTVLQPKLFLSFIHSLQHTYKCITLSVVALAALQHIFEPSQYSSKVSHTQKNKKFGTENIKLTKFLFCIILFFLLYIYNLFDPIGIL